MTVSLDTNLSPAPALANPVVEMDLREETLGDPSPKYTSYT